MSAGGNERSDTPLGALEWPDAMWLGPSPRLRSVRQVQLAAATLPVLVAAIVLGVLGGGAVGAVIGVVVVAVGGAVAYGFMGRRIRAWRYAEREDDLLVRRGVMFRRLSVIPYGRMQYIDVTVGPVERSFGLATVRMYTAAAASDARIPGLVSEEAARLRDNLARLGESRAAGL